MRASQLLFATLRESPSEAEVISHQLMLRAGMIRKLASGLYTWLPLGVRVLNKITAIIREEMNKSALEVLMPVTQPLDLWEESGRAQAYGPELLRFVDRHERPFVLGPTHEEVITDLARQELKSAICKCKQSTEHAYAYTLHPLLAFAIMTVHDGSCFLFFLLPCSFPL